MRLLLASLAALIIGIGTMACGDMSPHAGPSSSTTSSAIASGEPSPATTRPTRYMLGDYDDDDYYAGKIRTDGDNDERLKPTDRDGDSDSRSNSYYDSDDESIRDFGRAASASEKRAIVALLKSYYASAATGDGSKACSQLLSSVIVKLLPDAGQAGENYLRGAKTCVEVASRIFKRNHQQLATYSSKLHATAVRLRGDIGLVVLEFHPIAGRQIEVIREHGAWKMYSALDKELP